MDKITIRKMVDDYFGGDRTKAAHAAGIKTVFQLNNLMSQDAEVAKLESGAWIMVTKTSKIFKVD